MSLGEIAVIAIVAVVVIGPKRLPEAAEFLGKIIGQAMMMFRDLQQHLNQTAQYQRNSQPDFKSDSTSNVYDHQKIESSKALYEDHTKSDS